MMNKIKLALNNALFGQAKADKPQAESGTHPGLSGQLSQVGHMLIPEIPAPPVGFVWVEDGQLKSLDKVSAYELERERLLQPLANEWAELWLKVADLKARFDEAFDRLEQINAPKNTIRVQAGKKPSLTLFPLDRSFSLSRKRTDTVRYEEDKLLAAKQLVDVCVNRWAAGGREEIKQIAELAFTKNQQGEYSRSGMVRLRRIESDEPEWQEAMETIRKAEIVDGVSSYLLVSVRDKDGKYHPLPLDIASVRPYRMASAP